MPVAATSGAGGRLGVEVNKQHSVHTISSRPGGGPGRLGARFVALGIAMLLGCGFASHASGQVTQLADGAAAQNAPIDAEALAQSQPTTEPTSQPASQPVNLQRSPRQLLGFFLERVADESTLHEAQAALNFTAIDAEVAAAQGDDYVRQLAEIIDRMLAADLLDRDALPDQPDAPPQTLGLDPLLLTLERGEDRRWRFSAATVADIPKYQDGLADLVRQATHVESARAPEPTTTAEANDAPAPPDPLRSPYHLVESFLIRVNDAKTDPQAYEDAIGMLDYASVAEGQELTTEAQTRYVDDLAAVFRAITANQQFDRESLPKNTDQSAWVITGGKVANETGGEQSTFEIRLVRQADGRWRFNRETVATIPDLYKRLAGEKQDTAIPIDNSSAQATLNKFLVAMNAGDLTSAVECLNLSRLRPELRDSAPMLAGKLWMVLNRSRMLVAQDVDANPDRPTPWTIFASLDGRVEIDRVREGDRKGEWLFSPKTVASIERLYLAREDDPILPELSKLRVPTALPALYLREHVVPKWMKRDWLGLDLWQWIGIGLIIIASIILRVLAMLVLPRVTRWALSTAETALLPSVVQRALRPSMTFVMLAVFAFGLQFLDLGAAVMSWTWRILNVALAIYGVMAVYKLIGLFTAYLGARAAQTKSRMDDVLIPLADRTLKIIVVAAGVLFVGSVFGFEITPMLAGLGLGGLAFGLAAQDTLKNFFGSVNVILDQPFQVGDWIKVGSTEGTVKAVGIRSTRIATFYDSEVTVPNSEIMNATVDNMGRRRYRRISCKLGVTYSTTPEQLDAFCEGIRELIRTHPYTRKDYYHVWTNEFGDSGILVLLYCFHEAPDWGTELRERHRLFLDIMRVAKRLGVDFAFPTQTVHLHHESSPPDGYKPPQPPVLPAGMDAAAEQGRAAARDVVGDQYAAGPDAHPPVKF